MPAIIQYLLKLSVSIAVIHAFYYLVLRRLTFYNLNRWYLVGYTVLCLVIPFINITPIATKANEALPALSYIPSVQNINKYIPADQPTHYNYNIWDAVIILLAIGSAVMLLKLIGQIISFIRLKQKAELLSDNGAAIYHIDGEVMPFSFGNSIYLNKNKHTDAELEEIIMHEYVHVKQMHSADILIAELFCVVNWYNPFAWFMRHSIRQNLEFIADDNVVRSGIDKKAYQYHLLKVVGIPQYRIANQFNFSSLKKRIIMMNQRKTAKIHLLKFMFIVPLLAVTLMAFRSEIAVAVNRINVLPATIKVVSDVVPATLVNHAIVSSQIFVNKHVKSKISNVAADTNKISASNTATGYGTSTSSADKDVTVNGYAKSADSYSATTADNSGNGYVTVKGYAINGSKNTFSADASPKNNAVTVTGYRLNSINGNVAKFNSTLAPLAAVTIPDNAGGDDLVCTIDTKHIDENQFKAMEKQFADNGFDLKIKAKVEDGKASKLSVNISGSREGSSSSASETFTTDNTDKKECFIRITASSKTGMVSITTSSPGDK